MATERRLWCKYLLIVCCSLQLAVVVLAAQNTTPTNTTAPAPVPVPAPAPAPQPGLAAEDSCVGVFLRYQVTESPKKIRPYSSVKSKQPYSFESYVTLTNYGYEEVAQWEMSIDFQYSEVIAEASGVMFVNGLAPPGLHVGNDTRIIGVDTPGLLTSIDTAENEDLISANFTLTGTEFGVDETGIPLPSNMSVVNDGYSCNSPAFNGGANVASSQMWVCCTENITEINSTSTSNTDYLPRQEGDVTMTYDIMAAYPGNYKAQVSISMDDPIGRVDHWNLSWQWTQGEFIDEMEGAQIEGPNDQNLCVYGAAAAQYTDGSVVDFSNVMSCSPTPLIIDLTPDKRNDTTVGIPYCCRNGTILSDLIDPTQSKSNFQLHVLKLKPHMAQDDISPPSNWQFSDGYECTQPRRVSPTEFYPEALHSSSAVASWQVVCNKTVVKAKKCCVSFSSYFNDSVIPCPTCSCGCASNRLPWNGDTCNPNIEPMLLPSQALLLPAANRTSLGTQLAKLDHYQIPSPLPCPDNCQWSMNWHLYSDYSNGWTARMTLFNWDSTDIEDWSAAVELPVAMPGFQKVYTFNGTKVPDVNNTLFVQGRIDYDNYYLIKADATENPVVPGKLQSVLSFDKRKTPGINVVNGDGYPTKVWFNGEECAVPDMFPAGHGWRLVPTFQFAVVLIATLFLLGGGNLQFL